MRLLYDARHVAHPYTGLARYSASLLRALLDTRECDGFRVEVLLGPAAALKSNPHHDEIVRRAASQACTIHRTDAPAVSLSQHWRASLDIRRIAPDAYFYPHFDPPLGVSVPTTVVVHDLIPLKVPGYVQRFAGPKRAYFATMLKLAVRRASRCIAVSHTTRRDLLDLVGHRYAGRVDVAYEGPVLKAADAAQARLERLGVRDGYLLYVGDRRPHKNLPRLLELYDALRRMYGFAGDLVLAGSTRDFGYDLTSRLAGREDVRVLGNVTDADLAALYQRCRALAFLSAYEGFGLPVVEAARFGVPMVLSDGGALAEIAPPGACIVPCAMPVAEAGVAVARYLADPGPRDLRLGGEFTWQAAARAVFPQAYQ